MDLKNFETFLNKAGLFSLAMISVAEAVKAFNAEYSTNYNENDLPPDLTDYLNGFIAVTLFGWAGAKLDGYSDEVVEKLKQTFSGVDENGVSKNNFADYGGIDATTQKELEGKQLTPDELDQYIDNRVERLFEGLGMHAFVAATAALAIVDNRKIVASTSMRDNRVRPRHQRLDGKCWQHGVIIEPNDEFGCRCIQKYFKTFEEAVKAGYIKL